MFSNSLKLIVQMPWVKAEITNISSKGGHYYLELAEKDPDTHQRIAASKATSSSELILMITQGNTDVI